MSSPNWPSLRRLFAAVGVLEQGDFEEIFQQIRLTKEDIHQLVLESGAMKDGVRHGQSKIRMRVNVSKVLVQDSLVLVCIYI
jgi:hypothetical protein